MASQRTYRIAISGGPGGGKTTALDLFRREIGELVVVVPEAATLLFSGGFPRSSQPGALLAIQRAVYEVQHRLEEAQAALFPCLLYTSPSPRDVEESRMPSSA